MKHDSPAPQRRHGHRVWQTPATHTWSPSQVRPAQGSTQRPTRHTWFVGQVTPSQGSRHTPMRHTRPSGQVTAAQVAELAGFSTSNLSAQPNKWKKEGQIFAIRHQGLDYFPAYGLDAEAGYRPLKALAPVLAVFGDAKDGWGLAYWFAS